MKQGARAVIGGGFRLGSGLAALQVALSLVLLVAAGLFVRSFTNLAGKDVGFDRDPILIVSLDAANSTVPPNELGALGLRVLDVVRRVPGVGAAGASVNLPGGNWVSTPSFELEDGTKLPSGFEGVFGNYVGPGWFETLGMQIVAGRSYESRDVVTPSAYGIVIVNETFGRRFLKGNPVGQTIWNLDSEKPDLPPRRVPLEIVGVARDAMYIFVRDEAPPTVYFPIATDTLYHLNVRATGGPPIALKPRLIEAIGHVDPNLLLTFRTLADQISSQYTQERLTATLSGFFGALALLLAGLGLYGVTSYAVAQRRAEIGLRMALGAAPAGVVWLVMKRVTLVVGVGVVAGTIGSLWVSTFAGSLLYGVESRDVSILTGAVATLASVGAIAGWLPAQRAARIDPAEVLRE